MGFTHLCLPSWMYPVKIGTVCTVRTGSSCLLLCNFLTPWSSAMLSYRCVLVLLHFYYTCFIYSKRCTVQLLEGHFLKEFSSSIGLFQGCLIWTIPKFSPETGLDTPGLWQTMYHFTIAYKRPLLVLQTFFWKSCVRRQRLSYN